MIRKLLMVGAAAAIPFGALAAGAIGGGVAGAVTPVTCTIASTVTFNAPGITQAGTATTKATSSTKTSNPVLGGAGCPAKSKGKGLKIVSGNSLCAGVTPVPTGCSAKDKYYYGSAQSFLLTGTASLVGIKQSVTLGKTNVTLTSTGATAGSCSGTDVGFTITGTASGGGYSTFTENACISTDTGAGTSGTFLTDLGTELGATPTSMIIATAAIDSTQSTLTVS
jgi:hypothetical protein